MEAELHHISIKDVPLSAIIVHTTSEPLSFAPPIIDTDILQEAIATSEIFRLCALMYLFRVVKGDSVPFDPQTQESFNEVCRPRFKIILKLGIPTITAHSRVTTGRGYG